eukprot:TRINITY_DN3730_c0_g1_i2.p1 TRINITY_DN3730_c0_g1~~TRINITY_DN3730_c0_g1_i2.p1  ORF type:complete len:530 (-),score=122.12 TRINITY_DN3730_c0_g1_i2:781-2370(-)
MYRSLSVSKRTTTLLPSSFPCQGIITRTYATKWINQNIPRKKSVRRHNPHPVWSRDDLEDLHIRNLDRLKPEEPTLRTRPKRNIKELPTIDELAERYDEEHPYSNTIHFRSIYDTRTHHSTHHPFRAEAASNIVTYSPSKDGVCKRFQLHRPEALNALDTDLAVAARRSFQQFDLAPSSTSFFAHTTLCGVSFCSGHDWKALLSAGRDSPLLSTYFQDVYQLASVVHTVKKPCFVVMDGVAFGGAAAAMGLAGQFRMTSERTVFSLPEVLVGFFPDGGSMYRMQELPPGIDNYICLTGRRLNAGDLHHLGIANYHIEDGLMVSGFQQELGKAVHKDFDRWMRHFYYTMYPPPNYESITQHKQLIRRVFTKKSVQEMMDELAKICVETDPTVITAVNQEHTNRQYEWALRTLNRMKKASPLSLAVTFEYLKRSKEMDFFEILKTDYRLSQRFVKTEDLYEGLHATIMDKREPKWSYSSVNDVPKDLVDSFFKPFDNPADELKYVISRPHEEMVDWEAKLVLFPLPSPLNI